jgi:hypothetical protein
MTLSIIAEHCYAECHTYALMLSVVNAECHFAECCYAECHFAEFCYAECHFADICYAECRGAHLEALVGQAQKYKTRMKALSVTKVLHLPL